MNDWIDYDNQGHTNEQPVRWKHSDLVNYWKHLQKIPVKWGIKETTLLSKLMKVYTAADLGDMIQWWTEYKHPPQVYSFGLFYTESEKTYNEVAKERREWKWET